MSEKWRVCSFSPKCLFLAVWHSQSLNPFTHRLVMAIFKAETSCKVYDQIKTHLAMPTAQLMCILKYIYQHRNVVHLPRATNHSIYLFLSLFFSVYTFDMKIWAHFLCKRKRDKCVPPLACVIFCMSSQLASAYKHSQTHTLDEYDDDDDDKCLLWMSSTTKCTMSNVSKSE